MSASVFARATRRYWTSVFPRFIRELRRWRARAHEIDDPLLRRLALDAQCAKRRSLEGAIAFAAFASRSMQRPLVRALTAYQMIFDYLDTLSEQPNSNPIRNGRQLNQALLAALDPAKQHFDYYAHHTRHHDSGYLEDLIEACRQALCELPAYDIVAAAAQQAASRSITYQSLNHGDASRSHDAFAQWAREETDPSTGLRWWETGAAAGSSLTVLALISATSNPALTQSEASALESAYYPWIGALHTLLDSLVDRDEDTTLAGHHSLLDYYTSPVEITSRLGAIADEAVRQARTLPHSRNHVLIVAAMASFYLSDPQASNNRDTKNAVMTATGELATPTMLVMTARRYAALIAAMLMRGDPG